MPNMQMNKTPMPTREAEKRNKDFEEVTLGYTEEMALNEAQRCLNCRNMPCKDGCPVGISIPEFIKALREGNKEGFFLLPPLCRQSVAEFAPRKSSANQNVCGD